MINLISIELYKIFKKWRTYIGFIAIAVVVIIIHILGLTEGEDMFLGGHRAQRGLFVLPENLLNGYLIGQFVLFSIYIHIPFLITLVAGDLMAGEATAGTYRFLLTRPITRLQLVLSKYVAGLIYTTSLILFLAFMAIGVGILIFGTGELISFSNKLVIFPPSEAFWRLALAYGYTALCMGVVMSIAFIFSSMVENAIGPIIATMAIIIIFTILSNIPIDAIKAIRPYLFTTYIGEWRAFFDKTIRTTELIDNSLIMTAHIVGIFIVTFLLFRKKDILS